MRRLILQAAGIGLIVGAVVAAVLMFVPGIVVAWSLAAIFAGLYARNVAKAYRARKKAEFWQRMATYGGVAAGLGWLGLFNNHRAYQDELEAKRRANECNDNLAIENIRLRREIADFRKQLNLPENE